ncbi:mCG144964, partial [Mus musculus]
PGVVPERQTVGKLRQAVSGTRAGSGEARAGAPRRPECLSYTGQSWASREQRIQKVRLDHSLR